MTLLHRYIGPLYRNYDYESRLCQPKHESSKFIAPYNMSKGTWPHVLSLKLQHIIINDHNYKVTRQTLEFPSIFLDMGDCSIHCEHNFINPLYCGSYSPIQRLSSMKLYSFGHLSQRWVFLGEIIIKVTHKQYRVIWPQQSSLWTIKQTMWVIFTNSKVLFNVIVLFWAFIIETGFFRQSHYKRTHTQYRII